MENNGKTGWEPREAWITREESFTGFSFPNFQVQGGNGIGSVSLHFPDADGPDKGGGNSKECRKQESKLPAGKTDTGGRKHIYGDHTGG